MVKHPKNWGLNEDEVLKESQKILSEFGFRKETELSLLFVGRKKAKELNVAYRKMSYIPQVLGFPLNRVKDADGWLRLGDIVICTQKLKNEAKIFKKSETEILREWLRHGLENLLK